MTPLLNKTFRGIFNTSPSAHSAGQLPRLVYFTIETCLRNIYFSLSTDTTLLRALTSMRQTLLSFPDRTAPVSALRLRFSHPGHGMPEFLKIELEAFFVLLLYSELHKATQTQPLFQVLYIEQGLPDLPFISSLCYEGRFSTARRLLDTST